MTVGDRILILCAVLALGFLYAAYWIPSTHGEYVRIISPTGERKISLSKDQEIAVSGPLGTSLIKVANGKVRFLDSPCRNKQCIHSGWLSHGGEFAACLPNRVSLLVSGREPRFDTLNF